MKLKRNLFSAILLTATVIGAFLFFDFCRADEGGMTEGLYYPIRTGLKCCLVVRYNHRSYVSIDARSDNEIQSCREWTNDDPCKKTPYLVGGFGGGIDTPAGEAFSTGFRTYEYENEVDCGVAKEKVLWCQQIMQEAKNQIPCASRTREICEQGMKICFLASNSQCMSKIDNTICHKLKKVDCEKTLICTYNPETENCDDTLQAGISKEYAGREAGQFMPKCAIHGNCTDVNDILLVFINFAKMIFKYIGAIAFVFFIYGGFTMILSFGNAERFKSGQKILAAAVVGLIIIFSAYFIVEFVLEALNVGSGFIAM